MSTRQAVDRVRKKPGPDGAGTRCRLIAAALDLFGRQGFEGVGAREIAATAGAPLAAIPYHFGTKAALYHAVLEQVRERLRNAIAPAASTARAALVGPPAEARAAVAAFQGALLEVIAGDPQAESWAKLLLREHLDPTAAFDLVYDDAARDAVELVASLIGHATGRGADDPAVLIEAFTKVGEVLVFRVVGHAVTRRLGWPSLGEAQVSAIRVALDWT